MTARAVVGASGAAHVTAMTVQSPATSAALALTAGAKGAAMTRAVTTTVIEAAAAIAVDIAAAALITASHLNKGKLRGFRRIASRAVAHGTWQPTCP